MCYLYWCAYLSCLQKVLSFSSVWDTSCFCAVFNFCHRKKIVIPVSVNLHAFAFWMNELKRIISCFVHRASWYICVIKSNLMHNLSSVYFINQPPHVLGIFVAHHQELYCIYTTIGTCCAFQLTVFWPANIQSSKKHNTSICSIPPDDGLQICPKHVEVDWWNKLRINCASSWFLLHR